MGEAPGKFIDNGFDKSSEAEKNSSSNVGSNEEAYDHQPPSIIDACFLIGWILLIATYLPRFANCCFRRDNRYRALSQAERRSVSDVGGAKTMTCVSIPVNQ